VVISRHIIIIVVVVVIVAVIIIIMSSFMCTGCTPEANKSSQKWKNEKAQ